MSPLTMPWQAEPFVLYQSQLLGAYTERLIHGFSGRPLDMKAGKDALEALCREAGLNGARLSLPRQEHTDVCRLNDQPWEQAADAVIATEADVPAVVQVADCVPVLLYEPVRHVGAAIHAGWRGTAKAISRKTAMALMTEHGACAAEMIAVIGPAIGGCCYEVSEEVAAVLNETLPLQTASSWRRPGRNGRPHVDLQEINRLQLSLLGISRIEVLNACTHCETERLWSFRRGDPGRQVAFLQLRAPFGHIRGLRLG